MATKKDKLKGKNKQKPELTDSGENPLLKIDNKSDFSIESSNLLNEPSKLLFPDFGNFDLKAEFPLDPKRLKEKSTIIIILRYYEYICIATVRMSFVAPLLQSDMSIRDIFEMIKHALRNRLLLNAPSFDTIFEPDIMYSGKVKY